MLLKSKQEHGGPCHPQIQWLPGFASLSPCSTAFEARDDFICGKMILMYFSKSMQTDANKEDILQAHTWKSISLRCKCEILETRNACAVYAQAKRQSLFRRLYNNSLSNVDKHKLVEFRVYVLGRLPVNFWCESSWNVSQASVALNTVLQSNLGLIPFLFPALSFS